MLKAARIGSLVILALICGATGSAYAEFSAKNADGKGQVVGMKLEGGGVRVSCSEKAENEALVLWKIKKGEEVTKVGPTLLLKDEKWGLCFAKAGLEEEVEATVGSCELEVAQPHEEAGVLASVHSTCTASFGGCEVKLEPTGNKERKSVKLGFGGEKAENTMLAFSLSSVLTKVNSQCETLGIKGTSKATATDFAEMQRVLPQLPSPEFIVTAAKKRFEAVNEKLPVVVNNTTMTNNLMPAEVSVNEHSLTAVGVYAAEKLAECIRPYNSKENCTFEVKYKGPSRAALVQVTVESPNKDQDWLYMAG